MTSQDHQEQPTMSGEEKFQEEVGAEETKTSAEFFNLGRCLSS
jgi:hypothetical protein